VIYLDHNATMPILAEVLEAMMPYLTTEWGNPSKPVILSTVEDLAPSRSRLSRTREQVAELIGVHSVDIVLALTLAPLQGERVARRAG